MNSAALASRAVATTEAERQEAFRFPVSPFLADCIIGRAAEAAGYTITRRAAIDIDAAALPVEYYRHTPHWAKIRKHLEAGASVPGATLSTEVQYVLVRERDE